MGRPTGRLVRFIRGLGVGSDHFGKCEVCGKHVSETFKGQYKREWLRDNGEIYFGYARASVYGHESCVISKLSDEVLND